LKGLHGRGRCVGAVPAAAAPVNPGERIDAIDVLRGIALFGVLAINVVNEFRVSIFEEFLPAASTTGRLTAPSKPS